MKKKLFAILLSIVMVAGLLPTVAFAEENYNLYVNGRAIYKRKAIHCLRRRNRKLRPEYKDPYA